MLNVLGADDAGDPVLRQCRLFIGQALSVAVRDAARGDLAAMAWLWSGDCAELLDALSLNRAYFLKLTAQHIEQKRIDRQGLSDKKH